MSRVKEPLKATNIRLPSETVERIELIAGPNKMAAFIREAVEEKLVKLGSLPRVKVMPNATITLDDGTRLRVYLEAVGKVEP